MTSFTGALVLAASLAMSAQATSQYRYDTATSDANPTSAGVDYILIETTGTVIKWTLNIKTVLNEDTGYQYMRWAHTLIAPIQKDDEIIFEVAFQSLSDPAVQTTGGFGEDTARCTVAIDASDNRFWKGVLSDGYYECNGVPATNVDICQDINDWNTDTVLIETAEDNAWTIPEGLEDDELDDLTLRWCDAVNTVGQAINPLQCSSIKCHMERKLQTGDELKDFYFSPSSSTSCDTMVIRPGRARIFFNQQTYNKAFGTMRTGINTTLQIPICAGASTLAAAVAGLAFATSALF